MQSLILSHHLAVGDVVVSTALIRDIHKAYPNAFRIAFETNMTPVVAHNPYIVPTEWVKKDKNVKYIRLDYGQGLEDQAHRPIHFMQQFHEVFRDATGLSVPLNLPYPDIHMSEEEKETREYEKPYWVIFAGGKNDFPVKIWDWKYAQTVVDGIRERGFDVVQSGGKGSRPAHIHYPLENCHHSLGKADLRQLFRLIYHSEGVICGITGPMHIAAALQKPCVVVAGGRESWWWEAYVKENPGFTQELADKLTVPHRYLHTFGLMDCCQVRSCWVNRVRANERDNHVCKRPVEHEHQDVAGCLALITPKHVLDAVDSYQQPEVIRERTPAFVVLDETKPLQLVDCKSFPAIVPTMPIPPKQTLVPESDSGERLKDKPEKDDTSGFELSPENSVVINEPIDSELFDQGHIGGAVTVCVLLYGDYHAMHVRAINDVLHTVPKHRLQLRIGANAVSKQTEEFLQELADAGSIQLLVMTNENRFKYPVMQELFDETVLRLNEVVIWFDDDSQITKQDWCVELVKNLRFTHARIAMAGQHASSTLRPEQLEFYKTRPWFKGKLLRDTRGTECAEGRQVYFMLGGWWVIRASVIRKLGIPDPLLTHNGGDICIGEMIHQHDYGMQEMRYGIKISNAKRRGESQQHFGTKSWQAKYLQQETSE